MKRPLLALLLAALMTAGCASQDVKAPCKRPVFGVFMQPLEDCGPLKRFPQGELP
jgi:hypothetical protein